MAEQKILLLPEEDILTWDCHEPYKTDDHIVVMWPESQTLFDLPGFRKNSWLIDDETGCDLYGSSAYVVSVSWLKEQNICS